MIHEFIQEYGWYIVSFLLGFIVTMIWWLKSHPEDFWHRDEDEEQTVEIEEIDHV